MDLRGSSGHFRNIGSIACAELRSLWRTTSTHVFIALAFLGGSLTAAYAFASHYGHSHVSPSAGGVNPRFLAASFGFVVLCVLLFGTVFLAFDCRSRDVRARIVEVLDARSFSNLDLLLGKAAAVVLTVWLPLLLFVMVFQVGGTIADGLWIAGEPFEWTSAARLLFVDAPSVLLVWCSTVMLLTVALRNRFAVSVISLVLLFGLVWGLFQTPLYLLPATSVFGNVGSFGSDILPSFVRSGDMLKTASLVMLAVGVLVVAAALHPRPDTVPFRQLVAGSVLATLGVAGIGLLAAHAFRNDALRETWSAYHARMLVHPRPDVRRLSGSIGIQPGDRLVVDVEVQLAARANESLDLLLLSFNPGLQIDELRVDGNGATYSHRHGVLAVEMPEPLGPGTVAHLSVAAHGMPDPRFGYLDSAIDVSATSLADSQLSLLGTEASLFDSRFVALMPGVHWLPAAGVNFGRGHRPPDLFHVDLEVKVPSGWLVAGPGRRRHVRDSAQTSRFRFAPTREIPEVALIASRFESRRMTVGGVELETLFHEDHRRNYELHGSQDGVGSPGASFDVRFVAEYFYLNRAQSLGLPYPYDGLTFVEVPATLRGYGGGWRMDSVLALPGVVLFREHGFPTAAFDFGYWLEGRGEPDLTTKWLLHLLPYFGTDFTGGNPYRGVPKSSLHFLSGIQGDGALALEFLLHEMAIRLLAQSETHAAGYFSAHLVHAAPGVGRWHGAALVDRLLGVTAAIHEASVLRELDRDAVWNLASTVPLAEVDPYGNPRDVLGVLVLKAQATARAIIDLLGVQRAAQMLSNVRQGLDKETRTVAEVHQVASKVDGALDSILHNYLYESSIPGYTASPPEGYRIVDDERGAPRYQIRLHVRNEESVAGFVRLFYVGRTPSFHFGFGDTVRIDGLASAELGVITDAPPDDVTVQVYFARNRSDLRFELPALDPSIQVRERGFHGARPSAWEPKRQDGIVIDDLDRGFGLLDDRQVGIGTDDAACFESAQETVALPTFPAGSRLEGTWQRQEVSSSWGKYRHTVARTSPGDGSRNVVFAARVPHSGTWRLDYHWPDRLPGPPMRSGSGATYRTDPTSLEPGNHDLTLIAAGETEIAFDASQAHPGWNHLGDYELPPGLVCLAVSNRTSGEVVVADAVRWRLLSPAQGRGGLVAPSADPATALVPVEFPLVEGAFRNAP